MENLLELQCLPRHARAHSFFRKSNHWFRVVPFALLVSSMITTDRLHHLGMLSSTSQRIRSSRRSIRILPRTRSSSTRLPGKRPSSRGPWTVLEVGLAGSLEGDRSTSADPVVGRHIRLGEDRSCGVGQRLCICR